MTRSLVFLLACLSLAPSSPFTLSSSSSSFASPSLCSPSTVPTQSSTSLPSLSSSSSSFAGSSLPSPRFSAPPSSSASSALSPCPDPSSFPGVRETMAMKKGKPNVPPMMRSQFKQQQDMAKMKEDYEKNMIVGDDVSVHTHCFRFLLFRFVVS